MIFRMSFKIYEAREIIKSYDAYPQAALVVMSSLYI